MRVILFEDFPKVSSRRLSERESELVVAEEVPLPGLKGPDHEARAFRYNISDCCLQFLSMFKKCGKCGTDVGPKSKHLGGLALGDWQACVRMSHYRFGGKTQLPGFESEREALSWLQFFFLPLRSLEAL